MKANMDIRETTKRNGLFLWQVAEQLGTSDSDFSRRLRRELPEDEKEKIRTIIAALAAEREGKA